ncbi:MAG: cell division protein FtsX, partial [Bacteroidaceae bacterium]
KGVNDNIRRITAVLLVIAALLVVISLSLIHNTVRLSVYSQRFTIRTMRLVGARWSFIRRPFLWRAVLTGVLAALVANGVLWGAMRWAVTHDSEVADFVPLENMLIAGGCILLVGLLMTVACTFVSVTHYLKARESSLY